MPDPTPVHIEDCDECGIYGGNGWVEDEVSHCMGGAPWRRCHNPLHRKPQPPDTAAPLVAGYPLPNRTETLSNEDAEDAADAERTKQAYQEHGLRDFVPVATAAPSEPAPKQLSREAWSKLQDEMEDAGQYDPCDGHPGENCTVCRGACSCHYARESACLCHLGWRHCPIHQDEGHARSGPSEPTYPCDNCGKLRTKAEGGTTFTVCDECWDKYHHEGKE